MFHLSGPRNHMVPSINALPNHHSLVRVVFTEGKCDTRLVGVSSSGQKDSGQEPLEAVLNCFLSDVDPVVTVLTVKSENDGLALLYRSDKHINA